MSGRGNRRSSRKRTSYTNRKKQQNKKRGMEDANPDNLPAANDKDSKEEEGVNAVDDASQEMQEVPLSVSSKKRPSSGKDKGTVAKKIALDNAISNAQETQWTPQDITLGYRGKYMREMANKCGKDAVSSLLRSVRALKKKGLPIYLPTSYVTGSDLPLDKDRGMVGLLNLPFKRPCLCPFPSSGVKSIMDRYYKQIEGVLYVLPTLPVAVKTTKLALMLTGTSFQAMLTSWDLLRYYMAIKIILCGSKDIVPNEERIRIEKELEKDQQEAFEEFDANFMSIPRKDEDGLRKLDLAMLLFTYSYINCYEKLIVSFLMESPCGNCSSREKPIKTCAECSGTGKDGIPRKYLGDFRTDISKDVPMIRDISDSLWDTLVEEQGELCKSRNTTFGLVDEMNLPEPSNLNKTDHVQMKYLSCAWNFVSQNTVGEDILSLIKCSAESGKYALENEDDVMQVSGTEGQGEEREDEEDGPPALEPVEPESDILESMLLLSKERKNEEPESVKEPEKDADMEDAEEIDLSSRVEEMD